MLSEVTTYFNKQADGKAKKALKALRKSDDPFIRWIADKPELFSAAYRSYTEEVLSNWPMTRAQLDEMGRGYGLGETFRSFVREAEVAGVLPVRLDTQPVANVQPVGGFVTPTTSNANTVTVDVEALTRDLANAAGYTDEVTKSRIRNLITRNAR